VSKAIEYAAQESVNKSNPNNELYPIKMHLKWFNGTKGFGFVVPEDESYDAFLHITTLQDIGVHAIGEGAEIMCTIHEGPKGNQVKEIIEVLNTGSLSTIPEINEKDGTMTMGGLVKWFKPEKGFGFIIPDDGMKDVFVHKTCLDKLDIEELKAGQRVSVTLKSVNKGREAVSLKIIQ